MPANANIAIMGGTFDPIHYGHLASAETVRAEFGFEKILFVPSGSPPHKDAKSVTDGNKRYLMTQLAVSQNENFEISGIEIERSGQTYTIDTVISMRKLYSSEVFFITGADALLEILTWRNAEELLSLCSFIAITRPGYNNEKLLKQAEYLINELNAKIYFHEVPAVAISSSEIRRRVKLGLPIKYLLPDCVEDFIKNNGLYRN